MATLFMNAPWQDRVVLVTGGTRGIGRAIALRLAREKPRHIRLAYCLNHDAARATLADIEAMGVSASIAVCEVSDAEMQKEMFRRLKDDFGRCDVFVSNAARTTFRSAVEMDLRSWRRTMQLNADAFLVGAQLVAEIMRTHGGGRIIALSSLGSRFYTPNYAALGAAKAVIENLARYLAVELAPHDISVNVVCGGFIDTESMKMIPNYKEVIEAIVARTPAARLGQPDDLAGVVAFLCSKDADWVRGQTIIADGGFSLSL
jgi:enoyl-[acyl-carrier protein] reductase III